MIISILIRNMLGVFLLALICQFTPSCNQKKTEFEVLETDLKRTLDTTQHYLNRLDKYIENGKSRSAELEVLKASNSKALIVENRDLLQAYLDSLQHKSGDIKDVSDFIFQVRTQMDYINSLNASAKAILSGDSQNFGKWE